MLGVLIGVEEKIEMKKVEEYLEDGCVFVQGDYCVDVIYGDVYGDGSWTRYADDGECSYHEDAITKFAWRNSLGTAPTYTNLVEVKQRNGTVYVDYVKNIDFTLELSDDDVVQWKPYIECELDWHLGEYSKFVDIKVNIGPFVMSNMRTTKFYKYNRGE
jgi:hypothetical protein